ncbi:transglycosylase SLT domain-containing protein [Glacieibacterium frigidum]|uniref:Lytic transglycosylase domain-containing protein n=1 Tax=Glacieibacterium frigidum TaxID=2593303 RepID=A0A552UIA3_9SPHN|nr:transglycosylase SLT domain-containing protein [Glacieibacterium frigidum]TRW17920.1 lytic transglycosylase domain-containing protein [Glacieibacterium frigidum]
MDVAAIDGTAVVGAIRLASARTGVDFDYLVAQARVESGLDPRAAAPTSSARGLFQFTQGTWLDTVRRHGAEHGLGDAAAILKRGATPEERVAILDLRLDAGASSAMAAAFAQDNAATLERRLGRTANATDLYLAHFLGPAGAVRFLRARDAAPDAAAASAVLPAAARANAGVFTAAGGRARTLDEVYARFEAKLGSAPQRATEQGGTSLPRTGTVLPVAAARTAYLLLADLGA